MSFFEAPPPPPREAWVAPSWHGPPDNTFGVPFPLALELVRTDAVAIQLHTGMAYGTGIEFSLQLLQREQSHDRGRFRDPIGRWHMPGRDDGEIDPKVLRFGVELADGRKATVFDQRPRLDGDEPGAILMQRGGGGGDRRYDIRFWLWPLPPAGQLAFVVEWPAEGVALTRHAVDTAPMLEAAGRVEELWPGGVPAAEGGGWTTHIMTARRDPKPEPEPDK